MSSNFSAIIFDLDGTMVSSTAYHFQAWHSFAKRHGLNLQAEFANQTAGKTDKTIIEHLWQDKLTADEMAQLVAEKQQLYQNLFSPPAINGIAQFIAKIAELEIPWAIGTGASRQSVNNSLKHLALKQNPLAIVCADDNLPSKPHPATFTQAAQELFTEPANCLVFEDSDAGVLAANNAGMATIIVGHNVNDTTLQLPRVIKQIDNYLELLATNFLENFTHATNR